LRWNYFSREKWLGKLRERKGLSGELCPQILKKGGGDPKFVQRGWLKRKIEVKLFFTREMAWEKPSSNKI
jgi:hypothetical protein